MCNVKYIKHGKYMVFTVLQWCPQNDVLSNNTRRPKQNRLKYLICTEAGHTHKYFLNLISSGEIHFKVQGLNLWISFSLYKNIIISLSQHNKNSFSPYNVLLSLDNEFCYAEIMVLKKKNMCKYVLSALLYIWEAENKYHLLFFAPPEILLINSWILAAVLRTEN